MVCLDFRRVAPVTVISGPLSPTIPPVKSDELGGHEASSMQLPNTATS